MTGFQSYIGQFCDYDDLVFGRNRAELRPYLSNRFGLEFEQKGEMTRGLDRDELARLTFAIAERRRGQGKREDRRIALAYNILYILFAYTAAVGLRMKTTLLIRLGFVLGGSRTKRQSRPL